MAPTPAPKNDPGPNINSVESENLGCRDLQNFGFCHEWDGAPFEDPEQE